MKPQHYIYLALFFTGLGLGRIIPHPPSPESNFVSGEGSTQPLPLSGGVDKARAADTYARESQGISAGNSSEWYPNPDHPLRPQLALYAASEPEKAANLALRIPWSGDEDEDPPINDPIGTVMRVWGKSDPTAATAFYESMPESERKVGSAFGLVHGLSAYDVERAAKWVEKNLQHPDSVAFLAIVVPHMQPQRAERWLSGLPLDQNARELTRGLVASRPRVPVGMSDTGH